MELPCGVLSAPRASPASGGGKLVQCLAKGAAQVAPASDGVVGAGMGLLWYQMMLSK